MTVLDTDLLAEIQLTLQEDTTFSNGLWSLTEVLAYFNQRQYRFLSETKILASTAFVPWVAGSPQMPLPTDWIATITASWHDFATGLWTPLPPSSFFETDHMGSPEDGATLAMPQAFRELDTTDNLVIGLTPIPLSAGEMELIYVALSQILDGTGQQFDIPDDWVPYLKYGVYADMLGKQGRGQDLLRAKYCDQRYQEGIALAQALLDGRP